MFFLLLFFTLSTAHRLWTHSDSELLQTLNPRTVIKNVKEEVSKNTIQPPLLVVFSPSDLWGRVLQLWRNFSPSTLSKKLKKDVSFFLTFKPFWHILKIHKSTMVFLVLSYSQKNGKGMVVWVCVGLMMNEVSQGWFSTISSLFLKDIRSKSVMKTYSRTSNSKPLHCLIMLVDHNRPLNYHFIFKPSSKGVSIFGYR